MFTAICWVLIALALLALVSIPSLIHAAETIEDVRHEFGNAPTEGDEEDV